MVEFTGERVIPGQVDADLLNEHLARYTFAARLARGKRVLDLGCGAGYGTAELARYALSAIGADIAPEAVDFARENYRDSNLLFERASCTALPHPAASFDLVVAFEVIEHLADWRELLNESRRVLAPSGQFIVSTPNKLYYTESRGREGANPFHVHEFEFDEFRAELEAVFPHVTLFLENHVEGVTFQPHQPGGAAIATTVESRVDSTGPVAAESHFFLAVCAHRPQIGSPTFVYIPRTANVLRERERHIALLETEIATKNGWLEKAQHDLAEFDRQHQQLLAMFRDQKQELEKSNQWAARLNEELNQRSARIEALQAELAGEQESARRMAEGYALQVNRMEKDVQEKAGWARDAEARLEAEIADKKLALDALHRTETERDERTAWALRLQEQTQALEARLALYRGSRWVKLGRKVGLGPELPAS
ncbi:MAG: methyltransferase domain-containing protein [Bryobacteraceae bacterium]